jgi:broad-specificity NMP kinase
MPENSNFIDLITEQLQQLLLHHSDKRVLVLGTTCTGKSTMLSAIHGARDQDKEVFPRLTKEQSEYVCQEPWTEDIGRAMTGFVRECVKSEKGRPVFGTVVIDCDLIILLTISDELLRERTEKRGCQFLDAKNMQAQLEREVTCCGTPFLGYFVG